MGAFSGPADWWTEGTDDGREHIATKGIVQDGLELNIDPGAASSYSGTGTSVNSLSNSYTSTLYGGTQYSTNNGGIFITDGTDDYIKTTTIAGTGTSTNSVTWCVWTNPTDTSGNIMSMSSTDPQGSWNMPPIAAASGKFRGKIWSNSYLYSSTYTQGNWYYVCLVFNYSATASDRYQRLYVNGELVAQQASINYSSSGSNNYLYFGQANPGADNTGYYSGSYGAIQVYNRALSEAEIKQNFNATRNRFGI